MVETAPRMIERRKALHICPNHKLLEEFIEKLKMRYRVDNIEAHAIGKIRINNVKRRILYVRVPEEIPVYSFLPLGRCVEEKLEERVGAIQKYMLSGLPVWLKLVREASMRLKELLEWPAKSLCMEDGHCIIKFLEKTRRIGGLIYIDYLNNYNILFLRVLPPYMPFSVKTPVLYLWAGYVPLGLLINLPIYEAIIPMARLAPPGKALDLDPDMVRDAVKTIVSVIAERYGGSLTSRSMITVEPDIELLKHIDYPMETLRLYITAYGIYFAKPSTTEYVEHEIPAPQVSPDMLIDYMSLREAVQTTYPTDTDVDLSL